jgi:hypothetical protein
MLLPLPALRRALSVSAAPPSPPASPWWVAAINSSLAAQPLATFGSYALLDAASIAGVFSLYSALEAPIPVELPIAYGLSRLLRRVRLPVDLAAAALLARAVPALAEVKFTMALLPAAPPPSSPLGHALAGVGGLVDKYGLAYLAASRCIVGVLSVSSLYLALRTGVDVQGGLAAALEAWAPAQAKEWLSEAGAAAAGQAAGCWAAAAITCAPLLPVNILLAAEVGRRVQLEALSRGGRVG